MLFKQIEYFVAVIKYKSFTEAAEQCFVSQSAISQQIKSLEKELGVDLIKREGKTFTLTPAGKRFYDGGKVLLNEIEKLKEETIAIGEDEELSLTIGYPKNFSTIELQQAIVKFTNTYPEVNITVISGSHEELFKLLIDNEIDIKISEQRRAFNDDYYNYELKSSNCFVEISSRNPLSEKKILNVEDLKMMKCILVASKGNEESEKYFYENTLKLSKEFLCTDSLEQARLMVIGNAGYLPIDEVGHLPKVMDGIRRIPLYKKDKPIERNYFACWHKERTNYYIEEFAKLLKDLLN